MSTLHGFRLWSDQMRATASLPIPNLRARERVVQCVEPSAGFSWQVTRTTSATVPSARAGLRPRPLAIVPTPAVPWAANR